MSTDIPRIAVIVLNWNNYSDTADCLDSLRTLSYSNVERILVDNGSTDGSGRRLDAEFDEVETIHTGRNLGFAGGMNRGIREGLECGAEYVWLVNSDVIVPDETVLGDLVETMESNENIGILSPLIVNYPETDRVWFSRGTVDWQRGRAEHEDKNALLDQNHFESVIYSDYLTYCCPLIRAEVFEKVGLLAEEYFLYYEDVDHCVRTTAEGYLLATDTRRIVHHKEGGSSKGTTSPIPTYYSARARWLFARRFSDRISPIGFFLSYLLWFTFVMVGQIKTGNPNKGVALVRGTIDGVLGDTGRGPYV